MPDKQNIHSRLYGIFGGTFDPIHCGHLYLANFLIKHINFSKIIFIPNHIPPHRPQPNASAEQRLNMIKLAIANNHLFTVNDLELKRAAPSYTVETLKTLRKQSTTEQPLAFIIGQDALLNLSTWHQWQSLTDYCHLIICQRPGYHQEISDPDLKRWFAQHHTKNLQYLHQQPHGGIYLADTPLLTISATEIRQRLSNGLTCSDLLPETVQSYINQHHLYR